MKLHQKRFWYFCHILCEAYRDLSFFFFCYTSKFATFYAFIRPNWWVKAFMFSTLCSFIRLCLSVHSSVTKLVNVVFCKQIYQFCCKLAHVDHGARAWNITLWRSGDQRSRSKRLKIDLEAWWRHQTDHLGLSSYSSWLHSTQQHYCIDV